MALVLREVCGLEKTLIAQLMQITPAVLAQKLLRGKSQLSRMNGFRQQPEPYELPERLDLVLQVIYRLFNLGYGVTVATARGGIDLCTRAIRLADLLMEVLPLPEAAGLQALLLSYEARRTTGISPLWDLVLLEDQDRSVWNRQQLAEASRCAKLALASRRCGAYTLQAVIVDLYTHPAPVDWERIVALYDRLALLESTPMMELNRAMALAMRDGPEVGLMRIETLLVRDVLADFRLVHTARAVLSQRLGRTVEARLCYRRALALTRREAEGRFIARRLAELED